MDDRPPIFESHIRPMFRLIDREHMILERDLDLWTYEDVSQNADRILSSLIGTSPMPTELSGGPWPSEWIHLFERWIVSGKQRLELNEGKQYSLTRNGTLYVLTAIVELPYPGAKTWLDIVGIDGPTRRYSVVLERLDPEPIYNAFEFPITERFRSDFGVREVYVEDINEVHVVNIGNG